MKKANRAHEPLDRARREQGMSLPELKRASGMRCSIPSLSRKLAGKRRLTDREIERIARALGVEVSFERTTTVVTFGRAA